MSSKLIKVFLLSWILFYQQAFANQVFFLDNRGDVIRDYAQTISRMDVLGLTVSNMPIPNNHPERRRLRELRDIIRDNARGLRGRSPSPSDVERINLVRRSFAEYRSLAGEDLTQRVFDNAQSSSRTSLFVEILPEDQDVLTSNQIPSYCQNYPIMDRDVLRSFYGGATAGENFNCYQLGGNGIGLDLSEIGEALISLEASAYERQKRELQRALMMKAIEGILQESSAYAGIYPGTDDNLGSLNRCGYGQGQELRNLVSEHRRNLPERINQFNQVFGPEENARRNALMASQVRQALIIGNLYNIGERAQSQPNGEQVATVGGTPYAHFTPEVRQECRQRMEREHDFSIPENPMDFQYLPQRCEQLVAQNRYSDPLECARAYAAFESDINNRTAQMACHYQLSGRGDEAPLNIVADNIIPLMSAHVDSNPLLFNRQDSRSLFPFTSSQSSYVRSDFANAVRGLPGAREISRAVEEVLASNPADPESAIEARLAQTDMLDLMARAITAAQQSEEVNNALKTEITNYQNELGESAANVCRSDGEFLHQFPTLVNEVIADELEGVSDPQERERLLARRQAAQCWMLEETPPESEGGLPSGLFALGVGAIALGMVPGIGWVASAALVAAGTGVAATDSYLRFDHARDQFNATNAAFLGGWADANLVLQRAAERTDAQTNLWLEGLSVGILDVAAPIARAGFQTVRRTSDDVVEAVNRQARGGSPTSIADDQLPRPNGSRDEVLANAGLSESDRIALIRRDYPNLNEAQIDAIMRSHREVDCAVYTCTPAQLRRKLEIMAEAGVPEDVRSAVIRRGIAGNRSGTTRTLNGLSCTNCDDFRLLVDDVDLAHIREHVVPLESVSNDLMQNLDRIREGLVSSTNNRERERSTRRILESLTGFRVGKPTDLFPNNVDPEDIINSFDRTQFRNFERLGDSPNFRHKYEFEYGEDTYEIYVCATSPSCVRTQQGPSGERVEVQVSEGHVLTIFPKCGPNITTLLAPSNAARAVNRALNSDSMPESDILSLITRPNGC